MRWQLGIRAKVQIAVAISLVLLSSILFVFVRKIVFASYDHLERDDVQLSVERVSNAEQQFRELLYEREYDWASWDDAYQFVQDGNQTFKKVNLGPAELASNKIDLMLFIRADGSIVNQSSAQRETGPGAPILGDIVKEVGLDSLEGVRHLAKTRAISILHRGRPLNIAIRPITKTNGKGVDVGWLVWGQYVMPRDFQRMAADLKMQIDDMSSATAEKDAVFNGAYSEIGAGKLYKSKAISTELIYAYNIVRDFHERPMWVQRITLPRNFYAQGLITFETIAKWLVIGCAIFCVFLFLAIDYIFLKRVRDLSRILKISDDPSLVHLAGNDELSELADTFRETLEALRSRRAELSRVNENLEETVRARTLDLTRAISEAERANAAKSEFLSHMSHELRTPLNAVIGFAQLLQMRAPDPKTVDSADAILNAGQHLLDLVNEILDLARIESGKLTVNVEPVVVADVLSQAISLIRPGADARNIQIDVEEIPDCKVMIHADQQRFLQVLLNVLSNAVKYNRPNGHIHIRCAEKGTDRYRIEVQDTGYGIRDENVDRLFLPFERLGDQVAEGTGLGLALSKNLANVMGGELELVSTCDGGTTFALEFCLAPTGIADDRTDGLVHSEEELVRVVYIEDNVSNLELVTSLIDDMEGYELRCATQASQGIGLVKQFKPNLVVLDVDISETSGLEVLRKLKQDTTTAGIPVVVFCAEATEQQIQQILDAGAKTYLKGPLNLSTLMAELVELRPDSKKAA